MNAHVFGTYPGVIARPAAQPQNQWWRRLRAWFVQAGPADTNASPIRARRFYPVQRSSVAERATMAREMHRL